MRADDWIVNFLVDKGVTDVFGIPGVVVMDFLYAVDKRKPDITPHLNYHEQGSSYAACGYAQTTGKLGVAYATRGPGFTNMITAMADAYYDSIPVMFITAHSTNELSHEMRVMNNQEIDTVALAKSITKRAVRIDNIDDLQKEVIKAYNEATTNRKGPVFLDIWNALFSQEVEDVAYDHLESGIKLLEENTSVESDLTQLLKTKLEASKRPVLLIGNGARDRACKEKLKLVTQRLDIPILSSRGGQDITPDSQLYFGFVGSRATRYSNFILSKADLIISIGNRFSFPLNSKSFLPVVKKTFTIRIDIDNTEFVREIPNSICFQVDSLSAIKALECVDTHTNRSEWLKTCLYLKEKLDKYDSNIVIDNIMRIIEGNDSDSSIVCDVGNHSFWVTTAYAYKKATNRIMYSGSFGVLGSALPKSIGAYYATGKPVICFTGDQGIQFNIQELQFISNNNLPVTIVILNNSSSGMIMEREIAKYGDHLVHTTIDSGYSFPEFKRVAECYGIDYIKVDDGKTVNYHFNFRPQIVELMVNPNTALEPSLPAGKPCQDLSPELPRELYNELDSL